MISKSVNASLLVKPFLSHRCISIHNKNVNKVNCSKLQGFRLQRKWTCLNIVNYIIYIECFKFAITAIYYISKQLLDLLATFRWFGATGTTAQLSKNKFRSMCSCGFICAKRSKNEQWSRERNGEKGVLLAPPHSPRLRRSFSLLRYLFSSRFVPTKQQATYTLATNFLSHI